jgi:hypothetical protein
MSGLAGSDILPSWALIAISQQLAALKNNSLLPSEISLRMKDGNCGASVIHHRKT